MQLKQVTCPKCKTEYNGLYPMQCPVCGRDNSAIVLLVQLVKRCHGLHGRYPEDSGMWASMTKEAEDWLEANTDYKHLDLPVKEQ